MSTSTSKSPWVMYETSTYSEGQPIVSPGMKIIKISLFASPNNAGELPSFQVAGSYEAEDVLFQAYTLQQEISGDDKYAKRPRPSLTGYRIDLCSIPMRSISSTKLILSQGNTMDLTYTDEKM